jgi:hypothetical protein
MVGPVNVEMLTIRSCFGAVETSLRLVAAQRDRALLKASPT